MNDFRKTERGQDIPRGILVLKGSTNAGVGKYVCRNTFFLVVTASTWHRDQIKASSSWQPQVSVCVCVRAFIHRKPESS